MSTRMTFASWLWRILACTLVLALAQMLGGSLTMALALEMPRMPGEIDPDLQLLLLFPAALIMASAMAWVAVGLAGPWARRWAILAVFFYVVHALGTAIEASVFTTLGGQLAAALMPLPAMGLGSLAAVRLFPAPAGSQGAPLRLGPSVGWGPGGWAGRLALGLVAFPFFYFLFGMIIAPIVTPYYAELDYLVIPSMPTLMTVLFTRSALFLVVSLLVIAAWRESRSRLLFGLGFGHFAAVGFVGLIQTPFFPAVLRWTHGVEILADSVCYAAALVWLFAPRRGPAAEEQPELRERLV